MKTLLNVRVEVDDEAILALAGRLITLLVGRSSPAPSSPKPAPKPIVEARKAEPTPHVPTIQPRSTPGASLPTPTALASKGHAANVLTTIPPDHVMVSQASLDAGFSVLALEKRLQSLGKRIVRVSGQGAGRPRKYAARADVEYVLGLMREHAARKAAG